MFLHAGVFNVENSGLDDIGPRLLFTSRTLFALTIMGCICDILQDIPFFYLLLTVKNINLRYR